MSLRRAETRFLLPRAPSSAAVLGELPGWAEGLAEAGVEPAPPERADLVVAPASAAREALALDPELLLLEGRNPRRRLSARGRHSLSALVLPNRDLPELFLPVGQGDAVRYAVRRWREGSSRRSRARNALARELLAAGAVPPGRPATTASTRGGGAAPFMVSTALELLPVDRVRFFVSFGPWAHARSRGAFFLFPGAAREPAWVVKFARCPGEHEPFDRDERGLRLAARAGATVAEHAPQLVGRFEVAGLFASVETAAVGERLTALLGAGRPQELQLAVIDRIAGWIVRIARETSAPPEFLEPERRRLAREVVPRWLTEGVSAALLDDLPPVAPVFRHGDLWSDNLFIRDDTFTAVDWEAADENMPALWDLVYFLTDAFERLAGAVTDQEREEHFAALWRGDLPTSAAAFRWVREAAGASDLPPEAVGPLVTLHWLSLASSDIDQATALWSERAPDPPTARFARRWLRDPGLGAGWSAWRA